MKNCFKLIMPIIMIVFVFSFVSFIPSASALTLSEGAQAARCDECPADLFGDGGVFRQVTNTILYIVGVIAVIMLIIGGIRYVVSGGDSKKVTDAKNTVLYAIIGLVICFFSYAIVNFVITSLPSSKNPAKVQESTTQENNQQTQQQPQQEQN